jgi:hypothetical protein
MVPETTLPKMGIVACVVGRVRGATSAANRPMTGLISASIASRTVKGTGNSKPYCPGMSEVKEMPDVTYTCHWCGESFTRIRPRRLLSAKEVPCCGALACLKARSRSHERAHYERVKAKRRVRKEVPIGDRPPGRCRRCGKGTGNNRFFCPRCHTQVSRSLCDPEEVGLGI